MKLNNFSVKVEEALQRTVNVEAANIEEAISLVEQMYKSEQIVLDYSDFTSVKFIPVSKEK